MRLAFLDSGYGLLPTVKYILKNNIKHECFFFMSNEFPLGNLSKHKLNKLKNKYIKQFNNLNIDKIFVCCNTLSTVFKNNNNCFCILDYNQKLIDKDTTFIATPKTIKYLKLNNSISLPNLASNIEREYFDGIVDEIRNLKINTSKVVLGCTHYPLVKKLFKRYFPNIVFLDGLTQMLEEIESGNGQVLYANEKAYQIIKRFYPYLVLNKIYTS